MNKNILIIFLALIMLSFSASAMTTDMPACTNALASGLSGTINGGNVTITNNGQFTQTVGLAVYQKYDENISAQTIFDSTTGTVAPGQNVTLNVKLPSCAYQIDSFCGPVINDLSKVWYNNRKIAWFHVGSDNYCSHDVPEFGVIAGAVALIAGIGIIAFRRK